MAGTVDLRILPNRLFCGVKIISNHLHFFCSILINVLACTRLLEAFSILDSTLTCDGIASCNMRMQVLIHLLAYQLIATLHLIFGYADRHVRVLEQDSLSVIGCNSMPTLIRVCMQTAGKKDRHKNNIARDSNACGLAIMLFKKDLSDIATHCASSKLKSF